MKPFVAVTVLVAGCRAREGSQTSAAMKPFVAVTVLVAASLTAVSAAPALQQQVAQSSGASRGGQSPSLSPGSRFPDNVLHGFVAPPEFLQGRVFAHGPFGGQVIGGGFGHSAGSSQGQLSRSGNYGSGAYPGVQGPALYFPGQSFYGIRGYGNGFGWGAGPVYGNGFWSPFPGYGNGYGYGGGYSGFLPSASGGYGNNGALGVFGDASGSVVLGQRPAAVPGLSRGSRSSQQNQARRQ